MKHRAVIQWAGLTLLAAAQAFAHHSFAAEFDDKKPIALSGSVVKVDWMNPHIWIYLDTKDEKGATTRWQCEGSAPNSLVRQGWTRDALKPGDQVSIEGFRSKDGSNTCNSRMVRLPDGRRVFGGSADDGGPNAGKSKQ